MPGPQFHLAAAGDISPQHHQHGVVEEELVGEGMGEGLAGREAGGEDGGHGQSQHRADEAGGIHKGQHGGAPAAGAGEAGVEDQQDLDAAQMQRQVLQLDVGQQHRPVGGGHHLHHAERLHQLGGDAQRAADAEHPLQRRAAPAQKPQRPGDEGGRDAQPEEMIDGEHTLSLLSAGGAGGVQLDCTIRGLLSQ